MSRAAPILSRLRLAVIAVALAAALVLPGLAQASFTNPVLPGDYPDPSVVRVGGDFYATATSDRWAPIFPVLHSRDLVSWEQIGSVLDKPPKWAEGRRFWAPEITYSHGRFVVLYAGLRSAGRFCIGAATAVRPEGPWRERGRVTCRPGGQIDPVAVRREDGTSWLIWKAKGVGGGLYAQQVDLASLETVSSPVALIEPERPWERGVTEGPTLTKRGEWWYLFYAAGNCCKPPCTYVESVARSKSLLGPYEKARQPILRGDARWRCPGHGTLVDTPDGRVWMLHHAYSGDDVRNRRRQGVLSRVAFREDGWPVIGDGITDPAGEAPIGPGQRAPDTTFTDDFSAPLLVPGWQWVSRDQPPAVGVGDGRLELACGTHSLVTRQAAADRFSAAVTVLPAKKGRRGAWTGLVARDPDGMQRGIEIRDGRARSVRRRGALVEVGYPVPVPRRRPVRIMVTVSPGGGVATWVARGAGWIRVPEETAAQGAGPTRIGLFCRGDGAARFTGLRVASSTPQALHVRARGAG